MLFKHLTQTIPLRYSLIACLFFSSSSFLFAQIQDDFSDGDISQNPTWNGASSDFIVNTDSQLQLNAPTAGNSILYTQGTIPDSTIWEMDVQMDFSPSDGNALKIYLQSSSSDFSSTNGYFLKIGEDGSDDALELYKQTGSVETLLGRGTDGSLAGNVAAQIKVQRSAQGNWDVKIGNQGQSLNPQFQVTDATFLGGANIYFGLECIYTATRKDKFYFDNISILADLPDVDAPELLGVEILDAQTIEVQFDEALDASINQNPDFFELMPSIGAASMVVQNATNPALLTLSFTAPMQSGSDYTLSALGFSDIAGNVQNIVQNASFLYVEEEIPNEFEVLINEFFPDPSPSVGLPEVEFIELYNPTNKYFNLDDLLLTDAGSSMNFLPTELLAPNSYIVIAPSTAQGFFPVGVPVVYWSDFPALNNSGDRILVQLADGTVLDQVTYDLSWYGDIEKTDGGYSLERINPYTPCIGKDNWRASIEQLGGTPGAENSVFDISPDLQAPELISVFPQNENQIQLTFSEGLDGSTQFQLSGFQINPSISIEEIVFDGGNQAVVTLLLSEDLKAGKVYTLSSDGTVQDCSGNVLSFQAVDFGLPEAPESDDICINEILWNPSSGGARFVELYNKSDKILELKDLIIGDADGDEFEININGVLLPNSYIVLSPNPAVIEARFEPVLPEWIYTQALPSWPDNGGNLTIYRNENAQRTIFDSLDFHRDFHNSLLTQSEKEGVSIERIDTDKATQNIDNWTSAAKPFFGTPTGPNSATSPTNTGQNQDLVSLPIARLSPDGDGFEDFLDIQYNLPSSGFAANVTIYNSNGLSVQRIERQELISAVGNLRWDGDMADGSRARPGIYILYFEAFNPNGTVLREKIPFAVVFK